LPYAAPDMPQGSEQLLLELFAIFVSAKVVGEVFERLNLPAVLGEILAGIGLGPYALGWIIPTDTIHSVAEIGAIFVLFSAGLETSPRDLISVGRKSLLVAGAGVVVPFILGFAYMKARGDVTHEAVFVGAAMVATSVGITARVLGDMRVLSTRTAKLILGAAVFDDILGMVLLAVVAGLRRSCDVRAVHDLHRAAPGAPHRAADGTALHPERIAYRGSGHLPAALMAGGKDRDCRYHRGLLRRADVRRLCSAVEPAASGCRNHRIPGTLLFLRDRRAAQYPAIQRGRAGCGNYDFTAGYHL